jgi:carboxymethylenebutenolidase
MKHLLLFPMLFAASLLHAQDVALAKLEASPRHHEWVSIPAGESPIHAFVAFPEVSTKALTVIVIHENRGLTDWVRGFADDLAAAGHIAIAPDFLSGVSAERTRTSDFPTQAEASQALYTVSPDRITAGLDAAKDYVKQIEAANGKVVVIGFCWGGSQAFRYATTATGLEASFVFYGGAPADTTSFAGISAPVFGFYAQNDQRINAGLPTVESAMASYGKTFLPVIYPDSGHAFMRSGEDPAGTEGNKAARVAAMERLLEVLKTFL